MLRPKAATTALGRIFRAAICLSLILALACAGVPPAIAASSTSGGYSKPSSSGSGSSRSYAPSGRSSSGGYTKPSTAPSTGFAAPPSSAGDRAQSRAISGTALSQYRTQRDQRNAAFAAPPSPPAAAPPSAWSGFSRDPGYDAYYARRDGWYGGFGWAPPFYAYQSRPSFGIWDALFFWWMLDTVTRSSHADFFYNHANDPAYRDFRNEADRLAQDNADLRAKLDRLDREMAARDGKPRDPNYVPDDAPAKVALAADAVVAPDAQSGPVRSPGLPWNTGILLILLFGAGLAIWVAVHHRRPRRALAGGPAPNGGGMSAFGTLGNYVAAKLDAKPYNPQRFRIGMSFTADPTPFILAQGATKVAPLGADPSGLVTVMGVGVQQQGAATLHRLYLGEDRFFQLHLDTLGHPDECRYFTKIDEVNPASSEEWDFWLADEDGSIGLPEFQTKDGKLYRRAWAPGSTRIPPITCTEQLETERGRFTVKHEAMLYAAPTGLAAPAPAQEYILVSADSEGESGAIDIYAGIDVNPASLQLA